jgi:hypothetical protein
MHTLRDVPHCKPQCHRQALTQHAASCMLQTVADDSLSAVQFGTALHYKPSSSTWCLLPATTCIARQLITVEAAMWCSACGQPHGCNCTARCDTHGMAR